MGVGYQLKQKPEYQHFGPFTLDSSSVLSRDGKALAMPPKELALLKLLLRNDGDIVSLGEIEQELWPRQTVSYASIARCIYSLRKILGDNDKTLITGVPKRGYRLGAPVCRTPPAGASSVLQRVANAQPLAYSHYVEGQRMANAGTFRCMQQAVQLFEKACGEDPGFALAYSAIADCVMFQWTRGYVFPAQAIRQGMMNSDRALEIDGSLASAYAARGWFLCSAGDMNEGFASLETALKLDPNYARAYSYLSNSQHAAGLVEESVASARHAVKLDPHSVLNSHALSWRLFCSGMPEEALEIERRHMSDHPNDPTSHALYGIIAAWLGNHKDSLHATERAVQASEKNPGIMTAYTYALASAGKKKQARALADALPVGTLPRAPLSHLAMTYVPLGDFDRALEILHAAREEKCSWFRGSRFDPRIGELGTDPRFIALFDGIC